MSGLNCPQGGRGSDGKKVYVLNELDTRPSSQNLRRPIYPKSLMGAQIPREVVLSFTIDENGEVADAQVVAASHPEFAISALESIRESKFNPGEIGTTPVATRLRLPIRFSLTNSELNFDVWF